MGPTLCAIFGRRRRGSVSDLYRTHGLLRFEQLYRLDLARLAFKTSRKRIPDDIAFRLDPGVPIRPTRRQTEFIKPRATVQFRLPEIWSSISAQIRNIAGARKFRREVKGRLLRE